MFNCGLSLILVKYEYNAFILENIFNLLLLLFLMYNLILID